MSAPFDLIDAFADGPFSGNPAAVVLLESPAPADWMQRLAAEMNQSETAFVEPRAGGVFGLRWFTPTVEVDLCGHATLAAAHALWRRNARLPESLAFETRSGRLAARRADELIELDFPADPPKPVDVPAGCEAWCGAAALRACKSSFDLILETASADAVLHARPDLAAISKLPFRGVCLTARAPAGAPHDFVSRFFAPAAGIPEDPVTGSTHTALGPWWAGRLGKTRLIGRQLSARGGHVAVRCEGGRVFLGGKCRLVAEGRILA